MQFDAKLFSEVRVEPKHLYGKLHFVNDTLPWSVATAKQFKIFDQIVLAISVFVMNCFFWVKLTAKMFGHYVAMFHDSMFFTGNKGRNRYPDVTVAFYMAAVIAGFKAFQCLIALVVGFAFNITELLLCVYAATWLAAAALFLAALEASESLPQHRIFAASYRTAWYGAVGWIFAVFIFVETRVSRFNRKRPAAFSTVKLDHRFVSSGTTVRGFVSCLTAAATKFSIASRRLDAERLAALKAGLFDACHGLVHLNLLFGNGSYSTHRTANQLERNLQCRFQA